MHAGIPTMLPLVAECELLHRRYQILFLPTLARSATSAIDPLRSVDSVREWLVMDHKADDEMVFLGLLKAH